MSTVSNFWGSQIYGSDFNKKSEINYSDISDDLDRFDEAIIDNYKYSEDPNSNISKATLAYAYMNMFPSLTPSQALASTKSITKSVLGFDMSDESAITAYANNFTNFFKSEINGLRTMVTYLNGFAKGTIDTPEFDEDLKDLDESIRQSGTMERRTDYVSYSEGNALSNVTKGGFVDKMLTSISTTFPSMLQSLVLATPGRIVSAVAKTGKIALSTSKLITAAGRGLNAFAVGMSEAGGYIDEVKDFRYADGTPINRTAVMLGAVGVALVNGGLEVAVGKNVESLLDIKVPAQELFKNQARTVAQAFGQTIKYLGIENVKRGLSESLTEVSQEVTPMLARALTLNYYKNHGKSFEEDFHYSPEYINKRVWDVAVSTFLGTTVLGIPADAGKVAYDMMGGNIRWVSDANYYAKQNGTQVNGELVMKNQLRSTTDSSGVKSFVSASDSEANTDSKEINVIKIGDEYVLATKSDADNIKKAGSAVYANVIKDVKYKTASSSDIDGIIDSLEGLGIKVQKKDGKIAYSDSEELAMKIAEAGKLDGYASTDSGAVLSVKTPAGKFNVDVTNDIEGAENFDSEKFDTENQKLNQQRQFDERVKQSESYTEKQNKASFDKAVDSANASLTEEQIASNKKSRNTISYKISEAYRKASSASGLKSKIVGRASTFIMTKYASLSGLSADEFLKNNMNDEFIVVVDGSEKDSNGNPLFRMENGKYLDNGALKKIGGKYTIFINRDATTTTIAHEFSHVFLDTLKDTKVLAPFMEIDAFKKAFDEGGLSKTGKGSFQELFSEGIEQYMLSGKASNTEIKNVFDSLLSVIKDTFMSLGMGDRLNSRLRNSFNLSDDTAAAFNRIFEERGIPTAEDSSVVQNGNNDEVRHSSIDSGSLNGEEADDNIKEEGRYGYFRRTQIQDYTSEGSPGNVQKKQVDPKRVSEILGGNRKNAGQYNNASRYRILRRESDVRIKKHFPLFYVRFNDNFSGTENITSSDFKNSLDEAKESLGSSGLLVDSKEVSDYDTMRLFLSEDRNTGFAITDDGDLVSVFNNSSTKGRMKEIMVNAILNGAVKLDCFDRDVLVANYQRWGFVPVSKVAYAEGFDSELDAVRSKIGITSVVSMYYDGSNIEQLELLTKEYDKDTGSNFNKFVDKILKIQEITSSDDPYSKMLEERDDVLDHKVAEAEAEYKAGKNRTQYSTITSETDEETRNELIEQKTEQDTELAIENINDNKALARISDDGGLFLPLDDFSDDGVQRSSIDDTEEGVSVIDRVENGGYATYEELQKFKGEKWADAEMQIRCLFLHDTFLIDAIKNYMNNTPYGKRSDEGLAKYVERKMKKDNPDFKLSDIAADGGSYQDTFKRIEELLDMQSTADADKTFLQQFRFAYNKEGDSLDMVREVTDHNAQTRENLISLSKQLMDLNMFQDKFKYLTNLMNLAIEGEKRTESRFNRALTEVRKNVTEIRHVLMQAEGNSAGIEAESMIDEQEIPNMSKKAKYKYKGYTEMKVPSMLASGVYSPSASQVLREGVKNSDLIDRALSKITSDEKDAGEYEDMILGNEKKIDKLSHELDAAKAAYAGLELKDTNEALEYQNRITRLEVEIDKTKQKYANYKQMVKDQKALKEKIVSFGNHASSTKYAAHKKVIQKIISAFSKGRGADLSDILSINDDTVREDGTIMKGPIHQFSEYITKDLGYDRLTGIANSIIVDGKVNINFKHMNMSQLERIDAALSLISETGNLQRESDIEEVTGRAAKDATAVKADMLNVSPASADEEAEKLISKRARGSNDDDKKYAQKGNIDEGKKTGGLKRTLNNLIETPRRILYSMSPELGATVFGDAKGHIGVDNCTEAEMKETLRRTNAFINELARATGLPRKKFERRMFINKFFGKKFTVGSEPIDSIIPGMKISNFSKTDKNGKQKYNGKSTGDKALDILVRHYINDGDTGTTRHEYTVQKMIGIYLYSKQTDGINKLLSGFANNISPTSIAWVIKKFSTPEFSQYKTIADYIQKDSNSKYNQISALKLKVDNIVMNPVENYFELAGAGSVSDYDLGKEYNPDSVNQKFRVTQGMTMDRTNTVYTLDLNAINTYMSSIKKQEHYIAFKEFSARMKSMMKGKGQLYSFISTQYGTKRADMVDSFISSVLHSSSLYGADDEISKGISLLRNNMIAAKLSSPTVVLKQLPAIFLGMSKYSPAKILQALFINPTVLKNKVYGLSSTMENNSRSELASYYSYLANDPSTSKLSNTVKTVSEYSLKAMEFFDKHIKNAMWSVAFDDNIAKGMSELEASMKATEWVSETQTSSFTKDNAMMYNSKDSVVKSLLMFTSQMNKQFNMVAYDAMSMFGKGDTKAAVFNFMKYSFAVTLSVLASAFIGGGALDDDDDKFFDLGELLKNAGIESLSMVPFIGNELQSAVNGFSDNADVALISPMIGRINNFSRALTSGEADRIAASTEKIISSFFDVTGLPSAVLDKAWNSYFHGNIWYMLGSDWGNFHEDN